MFFEDRYLLNLNYESLCNSIKRHRERLKLVRLGLRLYKYCLKYLSSDYSLYGVPIVADPFIGQCHYRMVFKDNAIINADDDVEELKTNKEEKTMIDLKDEIVMITEEHGKLKKELRKYVGKRGKVVLSIPAQRQYVVEFPDNELIAFPAYAVKLLDFEITFKSQVQTNFKSGTVLIDDEELKERLDEKLQEIGGILFGEIEEYLRKFGNTISTVNVELTFSLKEV